VKRVLALFSCWFGGCALGPPPPTVPVRLVTEEPAGQPDRLVVFLRGRSNRPEEFRTAGLFSQARRRWPHARFVAPDLHLGYYFERTAVQRLQDDVIAPAQAAGITRFTLVGISLGGLGALLFDLEHPGVVDELVLLAPYLGEENVWREIIAEGGVTTWTPGPIAPDDYSRQLWSGLKTRWAGEGNTNTRVQLACGESDRFAAPNRLFAEAFLHPDDVAWVPGRHNWSAWLRGFGQLAESGTEARSEN